MPASTLTYVLSHIRTSLPKEILDLAFQPRINNTTIEQRIVSEIIEGPILLDTNLVAGKRKNIIMSSMWEMNLDYEDNFNATGVGVQSAYYKVPPEAREFHNIAQVIGVEQFMEASIPGSLGSYNGNGGFGNSVESSLQSMLNSRTFAQSAPSPLVTLEGTNIICFTPKLVMDGLAVSVMLEYDSDFLNLSPSAIKALTDLCLCQTQKYIYNKLRVTVDETEVVAGMEIGVIKEIVNECGQKAEAYDDLLKKFKGAAHFDRRQLSRLIRLGI